MTGLPPEVVERAIWDTPWPWPLSAIEDWAKDTVNTVLSWIRSVVDWIWERLRSAWDSLLRGIQGTVSWIWGQVQSIAQVLAEKVVVVLGRVWDYLQTIGARIMDALGSVLAGLMHAILDFFGAIAERVWGAVRAVASKVEAAFAWVADRVRSLLSSIWDTLLVFRPTTAEEVPEKLPKLIAALGIAGVGTMVALDVAGLKIVGSGVDLDGLKGYLREVFSPGLVQGALIGAILTAGYGPYIQRWVQSTFRTWIPTPEQAYILWRQGYLSEAELRSVLAQHGTPERWMAARIDLADYTPGMRELMTICQYTDLDLDWLVGKLAENGVAPPDVPKYQELFEQASLRRVHAEVWSAIYTAISYGVPARSHVEAYLATAKLRPYLRPYYLLAYDIRLNTARVRWWLDAYEEQVYRGLVEPETALERMLALGVDKSYAMARIAYQMARRGILWEPPSQ